MKKGWSSAREMAEAWPGRKGRVANSKVRYRHGLNTRESRCRAGLQWVSCELWRGREQGPRTDRTGELTGSGGWGRSPADHSASRRRGLDLDVSFILCHESSQ